MKLYLPTSSLNFNDIFATESISPTSFYKDRTFGTKRHFTTELDYNIQYITLFNRIPYFDLMIKSEGNMEEYPLLIEIVVDEHQREYKRITEDIYITESTIYLEPNRVKVHFFSKEQYGIILNRAKTNLQTKLVQKYISCFSIFEKVEIDNFKHYSIKDVKYPLLDTNNMLKRDQAYNHIKGFFYMHIKSNIVDEYKKDIKYIQKYNDIIYRYNELLNAYNNINKRKLQTNLIRALLQEEKENLEKLKLKNNELLKGCHRVRLDNKGRVVIEENILKKQIYSLIVNILIRHPKSKVGIVEDKQIEELYICIAKELAIYKEQFSYIMDDLELIKARVVNKEYGIDVNSIKSIIMKNLFIFFIKINSPDEIDEMCKGYQISENEYVFGFRGAFIGFSGLSQFDLECFNEIYNTPLISEIDSVLRGYRETLYNDKFYLEQDKNTNNQPIREENINVALEKKIYEQLNVIRSSKNIQYLTKDTREISVGNMFTLKCEKVDEDIEITIIKLDKNVDKGGIFNIELINKKRVDEKMKKEFSKYYTDLGIKVSFGSCKYPIYRCFKTIENNKVELNSNDKLDMVACLENIIKAYKMK